MSLKIVDYVLVLFYFFIFFYFFCFISKTITTKASYNVFEYLQLWNPTNKKGRVGGNCDSCQS